MLLLNLGLDAWLVDLLARYKFRCQCGAPAVAVGVFWSTPPGERYRNAMYLCKACAEVVDEGVEVHWVRESEGRGEVGGEENSQ